MNPLSPTSSTKSSSSTPFCTPLTSPVNNLPKNPTPITYDIYQSPMMGCKLNESNTLQISTDSNTSPISSCEVSDSTISTGNDNIPNIPYIPHTSPLKMPESYEAIEALLTSHSIPRPDMLMKIPQKKEYIEKTFHPKILNPFDDYSLFLGYSKSDTSPTSTRSNSPVPTTDLNLKNMDDTKTKYVSENVNPLALSPNSVLNKDYIEEEFDDKSEGNEFEVRRALSLKSIRTPPITPLNKSSKKVVRFADSLGLDLEVVRMYPDLDQPPVMENIANEAMKAMDDHKGELMKGAISYNINTPTNTLTTSTVISPPKIAKNIEHHKPKQTPQITTSPQNLSSQNVSSDMHLITWVGSGGSKALKTHRHKSIPANMVPPVSQNFAQFQYLPAVSDENQGITMISSPMLPFFPFGDYVYQGMNNMTIKPTRALHISPCKHPPKNLFFSPYDHLSFPTRHINMRIRSAMAGKYLEPTFPQPGKAYNFLKRVQEQKVCLEEIVLKSEKCMISGLIRVENVSFHKTVYVRYTVDDWITQSDNLCCYIPGSTTTESIYPACAPDGEDTYENAVSRNRETQNCGRDKSMDMICTDKFTFDIVIPFTLSVGSSLYFAILYRAKGKEYWDNNFGRNYELKCFDAPSTANVTPE